MTVGQLINEKIGWAGRMISGSKSGYRTLHPNNFALFNSNICTKTGKIWWGDIDLTESKQVLLDIAESTGEEIYVLFEMDGRFENEDSPKLDKAVVVFYPDQMFKVREDLQEYYQL
jgi:hypothetical protein